MTEMATLSTIKHSLFDKGFFALKVSVISITQSFYIIYFYLYDPKEGVQNILIGEDKGLNQKVFLKVLPNIYITKCYVFQVIVCINWQILNWHPYTYEMEIYYT